MQGLIDGLEDYALPALQGDHPDVASARRNTEAFIRDGHELEETIAAVAHREVSTSALDRRHMKRWIRAASEVLNSSMVALQQDAASERAARSSDMQA